MSSGIARLAARWRRQRDHEPQIHRARLWLGAALLVLLAVLLAVDPSDGVPERIAEGKHLRSIDYWRTWGWIAAAANAVILATLFATARRWVVGGPSARTPRSLLPRGHRAGASVRASSGPSSSEPGSPRRGCP